MHRSAVALPLLLLSLAACGGANASPSAISIASTAAPTNAVPDTTAAPTTTTVAGTTAALGPGDLDLSGAAVAAQRAIDEGDRLGPCPFEPASVVVAIPVDVGLIPEFAGEIEDDGQVFSGGEVDITYCQLWPGSDSITATGIDNMRIDVRPGTADIAGYFEEEWGGLETTVQRSVLGGALSAGCFDELMCLAYWQGDGLFVALMLERIDANSAERAADRLTAALPVVIGDLAVGR